MQAAPTTVVLVSAMRDQHRTRQELFVEVTALRKQVADLKEAMLARRRVEDALRHAEEQLRTLADSAPVGLCLFQPDGTPVAANRPFARLLGYESPAELQRIGGTLGIFGCPGELDRIRGSAQAGAPPPSKVLFRRKDGQREPLEVIGSSHGEAGLNALVVRRREENASSVSAVGIRSA